MMKLKYSICCGLDVHKKVIVATIVTTNKDGISEYKQKSFSTINPKPNIQSQSILFMVFTIPFAQGTNKA